jgi:hypothetical protein
MKDFKNISEAIEYHKTCYICKSDLRADFHDEPIQIKSRWDERFHDYNTGGHNRNIEQTIELNLTDRVDSDVDDLLTINIWTNKVSIRSERRNKLDPYPHYNIESYTGQTPIKTFVKGLQRIPKTHLYEGKIYESLKIGCQKCHQFSYVVQVVIDGTAMRVEHLFLNSEFISWSDNNHITHQINNVYATDKTEYSKFSSIENTNFNGRKMFRSDYHINIPLIPLNLNDPDETMNRIKKLNLFS